MHDTKAVQEAAEHIKSIGATVAEMSGRLDGIELAMNRPAIGEGPGAKSAAPSLEHKAFTSFLRRGPEQMDAHERKALTVGNDTAGGYLASPQMTTELLRLLTLLSPFRQNARVVNLNKGSIVYPRRLTGPTAVWVGEIEARTPSNMTFGQAEYFAQELATYVDTSNVLLEDADLDVASLLSTEFAEAFAVAENAAFLLGDGIKKPRGVLTYSAGTTGWGDVEQVPTGDATKITADSLIAIYHALKSPYRQSATWMMNPATLAQIRAMKDSNGAYLMLPQLTAQGIDTLLGRPIVEFQEMPDVAAGSLPVAFGSLRDAYLVADRRQLSVLRDPFTQATNGITRFHASLRVGGGLRLGEALKLLLVSVG